MGSVSVQTAECHETPDYSPTNVRESVLALLVDYSPITVEELVERLPQFRWVQVLQAISQLWGEGKIELEGYQDRLEIWAVRSNETFMPVNEISQEGGHLSKS